MAECPTLIQGTVMRATRLDASGSPDPGDDGFIATDGFISVTMKENVEAPTEIKVKKANGTFCVNQRSRPQLNWIEVSIVVCQVMPEMFELLTGSPLVFDDATPTPNAVGFRTSTDTYATANFGLELWTELDAANGGGTRWGYLLLPWLKEGAMGDVVVENGPLSFTLNTITSAGSDWGTGPYDIRKDRLGVSRPLITPIEAVDHRHMQFTSLAPPASVCGFQTLVLPS